VGHHSRKEEPFTCVKTRTSQVQRKEDRRRRNHAIWFPYSAKKKLLLQDGKSGCFCEKKEPKVNAELQASLRGERCSFEGGAFAGYHS